MNLLSRVAQSPGLCLHVGTVAKGTETRHSAAEEQALISAGVQSWGLERLANTLLFMIQTHSAFILRAWAHGCYSGRMPLEINQLLTYMKHC